MAKVEKEKEKAVEFNLGAFKFMIPMIKLTGIDLPKFFCSFISEILTDNGKIEIYKEENGKMFFTTEKDKEPKDLNLFLKEHLSKM